MRRFAYRSMKKSQFPLSAPSAKTGILACSVAREDMQKPPATDCVATTPFKFFLAECGPVNLLEKSREQMRSFCSHLLML